MGGLEGLLLLLLLGLLWRWFVWRKRFADLTGRLLDLGKTIGDVAKRLERAEQQLEAINQTRETGQGGLELPSVAPTVLPEAIQPHAKHAAPLVTVAPSTWSSRQRPEEAPLAAQTSLREVERIRFEPEVQRPKKSETTGVEWKPPSQINPRPSWRPIALKVPELISTKSGKAVDWETLIGGSWLNVIGIIVFVVGMALFAQYSLRQFGPMGKIITGLVTSSVLLVCGILLERVERYRLLAWSLVGGGWALLYFTAYAAHNIEASRIIADPAIGLLAMGAVAAGIITHSIRFRSQLLTGLAYGLGFIAVAITPLNPYTLVAAAFLAASQIAVLRLLPWDYLIVVAVAGTYLNHGRWLGEAAELRQEFWLSQAILGFYWLLFVAMLLVRKARTGQDRLIHLTINVANTVGMLGLSAWQILVIHGEHLYYLTAPAMLAYAGAAVIARFDDRRDLFRFNSSVAVALFTITLPLTLRDFDISKDWLAPYWTLGAIVTIAIGYRLRDLMLRFESYALCGAAFVAILAFNLQSTLSVAEWRSVLWWVAPSMIVTFLGFSEWLARISGVPGIHRAANRLGLLFACAATTMVASFLWKVSDPYLVGLCWLAVGLVFFEVGLWRARPVLQSQGYILLALSFAALITIDLFELYPSFYSRLVGISTLARWNIVGTAAVACYSLFWQLCRKQAPDRTDKEIDYSALSSITGADYGDLFSFAGTALVTILIWKELDHAVAALAWIGVGIALFEVGARSWSVLRSQAYVLFALAFAALLLINLYEIYPAQVVVRGGTLLPHWLTVGISAAAYYYLFWQLRRERSTFSRNVIETAYGDLLAIAGTVLLTLLIWKQFNSVTVALGWSFLALVLFELGRTTTFARLRLQAHALAVLVFARLFMANFVALGEVMGISHRMLSVVPVCALFYYFYVETRQRGDYSFIGHLQMSRLYSWGAAIALVALARFEFGRTYAVLGMAPLFVALWALGRYLQDTGFRFQSYVVAGLTFARSWATNAYLIGTALGFPERIVTMLPAVAAFALVTALSMRKTPVGRVTASNWLFRALQLIDTNPQGYFAALGATLMAILLYYELPVGWVTTALAIEGLILILTGMATEERSFRMYGLVLLLISLLKLVTVDVSGVEPIYRILSYIAVGLMLLTASLIYTRYRSVIERYI